MENINQSSKNEKKQYVLFTTREFGEKDDNDFLFNEKQYIEVKDEFYIAYYHKKTYKDNLKYKITNDWFKNLDYQGQINFVEEIINNIKSLNKQFTGTTQRLKFKREKLDKIPFSEKQINVIPNSIPFKELITEQDTNNLETRKHIYCRKGAEEKESYVFGYRCLDLGYDYVKSNNNFIASIIADIEKVKKDNGNSNTKTSKKTIDEVLNDFFEKNKITLILHEADINYLKVNDYKLSDEEKEYYIKETNPSLNGHLDDIDIYVFQHTQGFFVKMITDYKEILGKNIKNFSEDIIDKINVFFKYRKELEELEKEIFKSGYYNDNGNSKLDKLFNLIKNNQL